jgi:hypothetical protein
MIVLMREMFLLRTARFALVVKLASVPCLGGSPGWRIASSRTDSNIKSPVVFVNIYTIRAAATEILDG